MYRQDTNTGASFSLGSYATVFQAELYAIIEVATSKEVTEGIEGEIKIYSDSEAALKALLSARMGGLVQECWEALNKVAEQKQVNPVWIPAHLGFMSNERADTFTKLGSSESPITHRIR